MNRISAASVGAFLGALVISGCGGAHSAAPSSHATSPSSVAQTPGSSSASSPSGASPGTNTPEDAVEGLTSAELSGKTSQACSYMQPSGQALCAQAFESAPKLKFSGSVTIDGADISGKYALVEVTGHSCVAGNGCQSNSNPSSGMPSSSASFMTTYNKLTSSSGGSGFSPVPCVEINGKWYVAYTQ